MKDLGYSMDTGVLPVGRLPHALRRDNRYFGGQRLSLLVICLENQGNDSSNEHAELENSFPCNIHTCHPLSFTIGGKEASPPKKSRETAYRGTGSTTDSVAQISTDCKKRAGHIAQQCGDMPRPVFAGMSADLTGQRMSYTDLMVRFCSSSSTLREVCTVTR